MTAAFAGMLRLDRERRGMTEAQAARRFGVTLDFYRQLEVGTVLPSWEVYDAAARRFGWPQTFLGSRP
jgi:DNA-binding XRE family transcriptional regulator